jgi:hypothetical protein
VDAHAAYDLLERGLTYQWARDTLRMRRALFILAVAVSMITVALALVLLAIDPDAPFGWGSCGVSGISSGTVGLVLARRPPSQLREILAGLSSPTSAGIEEELNRAA